MAWVVAAAGPLVAAAVAVAKRRDEAPAPEAKTRGGLRGPLGRRRRRGLSQQRRCSDTPPPRMRPATRAVGGAALWRWHRHHRRPTAVGAAPRRRCTHLLRNRSPTARLASSWACRAGQRSSYPEAAGSAGAASLLGIMTSLLRQHTAREIGAYIGLASGVLNLGIYSYSRIARRS